MSILELVSTVDKQLTVLAGIGGAAAMAATDWRNHWRFLQHVFVGSFVATGATPLFSPIITKFLGLVSIDVPQNSAASAFIVGAFGIYLFEYFLAVWRYQSRQQKGKKNADNS